ncbi:MAG TPA: hypothetical protein VMT79_10045 [Candidatus Binatia bacterium]|nr:hypothetical protein [Candidatus Binatia bacterium]
MTRTVRAGLTVIGLLAALGGASVSSSQEWQRLRAFDIQPFAVARTDWFEAASYCALKEGARLCRPAEWAVACRQRAFRPSGAPEWVDLLGPGGGGASTSGGSSTSYQQARENFVALAMTPDCERGVWANPQKEQFPVRCCRDASR